MERIMLVWTLLADSGFLPIASMADLPIVPIVMAGKIVPKQIANAAAKFLIASVSIFLFDILIIFIFFSDLFFQKWL
jgi:hypothetical protein